MPSETEVYYYFRMSLRNIPEEQAVVDNSCMIFFENIS